MRLFHLVEITQSLQRFFHRAEGIQYWGGVREGTARTTSVCYACRATWIRIPRPPVHKEERLCLPTGGVGSILGKATSTTDDWNTANQTNKQMAAALFASLASHVCCRAEYVAGNSY